LKMAHTKGEERDFIQWGEFRFRIGGEECVLQAYESDVEGEQLFIPFRDATSGRETYGAGRYLVHVVGDCLEPREALDAVWEGFEVGRTL